MPALYSVAANLPHNCRKLLAIEALAGNDPISRIAVREDVSRKFIYQQKQKAEAALDQAFSPDNKASDVLFYLPVTKAWLIQLVISLALICGLVQKGPILNQAKLTFNHAMSTEVGRSICHLIERRHNHLFFYFFICPSGYTLGHWHRLR